jgi:hypothetical protein
LIVTFRPEFEAPWVGLQAVQIAKLTRSSTAAGHTIIVGASAGGFSVLNTAAQLTALGIPIRFIGIADGGFFPESSDVERFGDPPTILLPGHRPMSDLSPLSEEERKSNFGAVRSVEDHPKATWRFQSSDD